MAISVALGLSKDEAAGKNVIVMQVDAPGISTAFTLTDEDTYEHDLNTLIDGLKQVSRDMRRAKSGLTVVKEVPSALSKSQQRRSELS
jgi:hypothetical protein